MSNGSFVKSAAQDDGLPSYPFAAFEIPEGHAIVYQDGQSQKGIKKGEICFVPVEDADSSHIAYLRNEKGYKFLGCGKLREGKHYKQLKVALGVNKGGESIAEYKAAKAAK